MLTEAGILPHLASHVVYDAKKLEILTEVCWVLTYLTASYVLLSIIKFPSVLLSCWFGNRKGMVSSVVVLEESPRGSSRTNLQVLVLGHQVLVLVLEKSVLDNNTGFIIIIIITIITTLQSSRPLLIFGLIKAFQVYTKITSKTIS